MLDQPVSTYQRQREQLEEPPHFISSSMSDQEAVRLLNEVFTLAVEHHISDLHLEASRNGMIIRIRHNGQMQVLREVGATVARDVDNKMRTKTRVPTSERLIPHDGKIRFRSERSGRMVDVRVSFLPTIYGSSIVCRLLDAQRNLVRLNDIEMPQEARRVFRSLIEQPQGLFLISGPTGSGKTTTLYGVLQEFDPLASKIITVEDPVEYRIDGFVQCETNIRLNFAQALRSILRQDPDIVLVGEIRDTETARIAVQASLTGHLVLSTIHANNALLTVSRLLDLEVDPNALSAALSAVSAQRLLPSLCQHCRIERPIDEYEADEMQHFGITPPPVVFDVSPEGCQHCIKGRVGRLPIFEIFTMGPKERIAVEHGRLPELAELVSRQSCYLPLPKAALTLVTQGRVSFADAKSVVGSDIAAAVI